MSDTKASTPGNLRIWDAVCKTDPKHTKKFKRPGGFSGTAIKPMYAVHKATEYFGPVGIGWGWTLHETKIEAGMVFCLVSVWYEDPTATPIDTGRGMVGPQWGGTSIGRTRTSEGGAVSIDGDDECFKKSLTDGLTKCLSYLGFGGDVHLGQHDDDKYVAELNTMLAEKDPQLSGEDRNGPKPSLNTDDTWAAGVMAQINVANLTDVDRIARANGDRLVAVAERNPELAAMVKHAAVTRREVLTKAAQQQPAGQH